MRQIRFSAISFSLSGLSESVITDNPVGATGHSFLFKFLDDVKFGTVITTSLSVGAAAPLHIPAIGNGVLVEVPS